MHALLRLTVGTAPACHVTTGAIATIAFVADGYGAPLFAAALVTGAWGLTF